MRLEALGFSEVYDYVAGKKDWLAAGLAAEGDKAGDVRAGDLARPDPPTCSLHEPAGSLARRVDVDLWRLCVVVDANNIVHGLVTKADLTEAEPQATAERIMTLGPNTTRPSASVENALARMGDDGDDSVLVTTGLGELLGVLMRTDANDHLNHGSG